MSSLTPKERRIAWRTYAAAALASCVDTEDIAHTPTMAAGYAAKCADELFKLEAKRFEEDE